MNIAIGKGRTGQGQGTNPRAGVTMSPAQRAVARVAGLVTLLVISSICLPPGLASPDPGKVGVVDFYAPTPVGAFEGFFPERYAADDLAGLLSRAAAGRFEVMPRAAILQAEAAMSWHDADVLHFDRLSALARAVGADWLAVGWIRQLEVEPPGHSNVFFPNGNNVPSADASVVVQAFNAAQGRIVAETQHWTTTVGPVTRSALAERALDQALRPTVPALVSALTATAP